MPDEARSWHGEVLDKDTEAAWRDMQRLPRLGRFYLAGGTGLALHLGHRRSVDLDFFSSEPFDVDVLVQQVQQAPGFTLVAKGAGTLHAHIGRAKVSFLGYGYPLLFPLQSFQELQIADPRDIACMKVSAIAGRGTKRDFVDLYAVAGQYGLAEILAWFHRKFAQANYSSVHVLKALTYFEDADKEPMPDMLTAWTWEQVRRYFLEAAPPFLTGDSLV